MLYAIDEIMLARLKTFAVNSPHKDKSEQDLLLHELAKTEANPILSCLLWTKEDLVAACRLAIQGTSRRNTDGTIFQKTEAFIDPSRERLATDLAGDVDEFCLGNRNDIDSDIQMAIAETLRNAFSETLKNAGAEHG